MNMTDAVLRYLGEGCRLDDLQVNGLAILQRPDGYCFTTDPVILSNFAKVTRRTKCIDLGSGSGIIATLLVGKYGAASCDCVELEPYAAGMSAASVEGNGLGGRVRVYNMRMQDAHTVLGYHGYDLVVSNPPYTAAGDGARNADPVLALARHEVAVNLDEFVASADRLVKYGGRFCFVHQIERLAEICVVLDRYGFAPKRIRPVAGRVGAAPTLVLVEALKGGKVGVKFEPTLALYFSDGRETEELTRIYGRAGAVQED